MVFFKIFLTYSFITNEKCTQWRSELPWLVSCPEKDPKCLIFLFLSTDWKVCREMVKALENVGVDPTTSRMLSERSTIWANPPAAAEVLPFALQVVLGCPLTRAPTIIQNIRSVLECSGASAVVSLQDFLKQAYNNYTQAIIRPT